MSLFKNKPSPSKKTNGKGECNEESCSEKISNAHSEYRDFLKKLREESQKAINRNGEWLKQSDASEG